MSVVYWCPIGASSSMRMDVADGCTTTGVTLQVWRSGICGNGICEIGERNWPGMDVIGCPQDCSFDFVPCPPVNGTPCGGKGRCFTAIGVCDCFAGCVCSCTPGLQAMCHGQQAAADARLSLSSIPESAWHPTTLMPRLHTSCLPLCSLWELIAYVLALSSSCSRRYAGDDCSTCAPGWTAVGNGSCLPYAPDLLLLTPALGARPPPPSPPPHQPPPRYVRIDPMLRRQPAQRTQPRMIDCQPLSSSSQEQTCAGLADVQEEKMVGGLI